MSHQVLPVTDKRLVTVAICGNPNCGKTTLFNALTGLSQRVGNYPGVTVEKTVGKLEIPAHPELRFNVVDTPGSYSLSAFSPDEYIAARVLSGDIEGDPRPDIILCVIDATNLERGLYLLFQAAEVGCPIVVALNMVDLAERHGITIDTRRLAALLPGIPVVPVVASKAQGLDRLTSALADTVENTVTPPSSVYEEFILAMVRRLKDTVPDVARTRAQYLRVIFDRGGPADQEFARNAGEPQLKLLETFRGQIAEKYGALSVGETGPLTQRAASIAHEVVHESAMPQKTKSERVDRIFLHRWLGPLILVAVMVFMFQAVFSWAEPAMHLIDALFGAIGAAVKGMMSEGPLRSLLVDGVIGGVGSVLVFLPQIIILFLFIALLEDSGYMPRAAFLVDRLFGWCGLSGKSFVPMLSSFACAVPGIMATRTIENRKLRLVTIMVAPLMSCSARLPVYTIMIAAFIPQRTWLGLFNSRGLVLTGLYVLGLVMAVAVSFVLNSLIYRQERSTFMMDMPSYTLPTLRSVAIRITNRVKSFVVRAGTVILAITIVIWALSYYPHSQYLTQQFTSRADQIENEYQSQRSILENQATAGKGAMSEAVTSSLASVEARKRTQLAELRREQAGVYLRDSYFGRMGRVIAPVFAPLGWDWKITMAALASFPAREVMIATLGTTYNLGTEESQISSSLADKMRQARWESGPRVGQPVFGPAVALSIMVFFALCAQCGATLVTIHHETARWRYSVSAFVYMTALAYVFSLVTYQLFSRMGL